MRPPNVTRVIGTIGQSLARRRPTSQPPPVRNDERTNATDLDRFREEVSRIRPVR